MAYILHIDTSADTGMVALAKDGTVCSCIINTDTRNHAAVLNLHIEQVLADEGILMNDLAAIAVCGGPGSYTGLRISLSTAKGLCYVLDRPLMMHNKLELMVIEQYYKHLSAYENYAAILPARDKEYFFCAYNNKLDVIHTPRHIFEEELTGVLTGLGGKLMISCPENVLPTHMAEQYAERCVNFDKIDVLTWVKYGFEQYNHHSFVNLSTAEPFYLKQVYTHNSKKNN